jgi:hypothetical protein
LPNNGPSRSCQKLVMDFAKRVARLDRLDRANIDGVFPRPTSGQ